MPVPLPNLYIHVASNMVGRIATDKNSCEALMAYLFQFEGDHIEIGTMYGGTAIMAGLVRPAGKVYAIDPISENGYYGMGGQEKILAGLHENIEAFGLQDRVIHIDRWSNPLPLSQAWLLRVDTAFIDGDHTLPGALLDFLNLKDIVRHYIIYDNYADKKHWQVRAAVHAAIQHPSWVLHATPFNLAVLKRVEA